MTVNSVLAIATFLLVGITAYYAIQTRGMLKEMKRSREAQYAAQARSEIYGPLYDEVKPKHDELTDFKNPFDPTKTLRAWNEIKPSAKLRVPKDLKQLIEKFDTKAKKFYSLYLEGTNNVLFNSITEAVKKHAKYDPIYEDSEEIVRQIFENYKSDFLLGYLREVKYRPDLKKLLGTEKESPEDFFNEVCFSIESNETIIELRKIRKELIEIEVESLERYLEKIDHILEKYESKLIESSLNRILI